MKYYALKRKKDGAFMSGHDFRYYPPHFIKADEYRPPMIFSAEELMRSKEIETMHRKINLKNYEWVLVEVKEI